MPDIDALYDQARAEADAAHEEHDWDQLEALEEAQDPEAQWAEEAERIDAQEARAQAELKGGAA